MENLQAAVDFQSPRRVTFIEMNQNQNESTPLLNRPFSYRRLYRRIAITLLLTIFSLGVLIGTYLLLIDAYKNDVVIDGYRLISKEEWTDIKPQMEMTRLKLPIQSVSLVEINPEQCANFQTTSECLKHIQQFQMKMNEPDITYNFVIDAGGIYEGRGWENSTSENRLEQNHLTFAILLGSKDVIKESLFKFLDSAVKNSKVDHCFNVTSSNEPVLNDIANYIQKQRNFC